MYAPKGEVMSRWPVPVDDVFAPSAVLGGWPLTSYTVLGTTKGPENAPPPPWLHSNVLTLFTIQKGRFGSRSNID